MHFGFIRDISVNHERLIVGLDIGTSFVRAVVAEVSGASIDESGSSCGLNIIGSGIAPSRGIRKGVIRNIEETAGSIRKAVIEAEHTAGVDIKAVHIGITGNHIGCLSSHGVIAVKEDEIGAKEVDQVIDAARAVALPFDREMLHVIPTGYKVNGQNGISDPRGMGGVRLETKVQIITCATTSVQNLIKSCERAGLEVIDVVYQPIASAETVLTYDEKELGSVLIDIGGGTTDMAFFNEGNISYASVISIGGNNFTNDVAVGLRIPAHEAEELKKEYGCAMLSLIKDDEELEAGRVGSNMKRKMPRHYLVEILQPRAEELFNLIKEEISSKGLNAKLNAGVVLTGGAVMMEGMDVMAENILELPVRIGLPVSIDGPADIINNPSYGSAAGLALYAAGEDIHENESCSDGVFHSIGEKMMGWFKGAMK